ncbi:MAG: NUDIX domain-containing protein [Rickettsiales bacterium]|jgi:putative (di)nucleoside polyphosphate hydrolase|nr:NUDIX domain-containing protein [Rickettsiales bacterium]
MRLRRAVGAIILSTDGKIIVFRRSDFPENWQCPEGGMDGDETAEEAILRELGEEVGLESRQLQIIGKTRDFIPYLFENGKSKYGFDGQEKMFFLVRITDPAVSFVYDRKTEEIEFTDHQTVTAEELLGLLPEFKKNLYRSVLMEFGMLPSL